ncbi:hypothetical protein ACLQ3K_19915 [Tsukamurella sp. DT100]|uniref:hypothetical protein n=1 Tax=Tsukamurella sp. DT100 TaxID=3393415 RepID=UPI003CEB63C0
MNQPQNPPPGYAPQGYAPQGYAPQGFGAPTPPPRRSAGLVAGLVVASVLVLALLASTVTFAVLWSGAQGRADDTRAELATTQQAAADDAKAEDVAGKYAIGSSTFDYRDLTPWRTAITTGVSPALKAKLEATAGAMNQLLQPLQWVSKGTDPVAVVTSRSDSTYKVAVFVTVTANNVQATAGRELLTRYDVTLDKAQNWLITDVGGTAGPTK